MGSNPLTSYPLSLSLPHSQEVLLKHSRMQFTLQLSDLPREPKKLVLVQQNKVRWANTRYLATPWVLVPCIRLTGPDSIHGLSPYRFRVHVTLYTHHSSIGSICRPSGNWRPSCSWNRSLGTGEPATADVTKHSFVLILSAHQTHFFLLSLHPALPDLLPQLPGHPVGPGGEAVSCKRGALHGQHETEGHDPSLQREPDLHGPAQWHRAHRCVHLQCRPLPHSSCSSLCTM